MDLIQQEREEILRENNTAQETFETIISQLKPTVSQITIQPSLSGTLDLARLSKRFPQLRKIIFYPGKIVELRNIPTGITHLECPGNLLTELDSLPGTLLYINIDSNFLETLDLAGASHLEELSCNNNRLVGFTNLPKSLVKIYCDDNQIRKLDLANLDKLSVLHCSQNPLLHIDNFPDGLHDVEINNSPLALETVYAPEVDSDDSDTEDAEESEKSKEDAAAKIDRKIDYLDALKLFFRVKQDYESKLLKKRQVAYKRQPTKKLGRKAAMGIKANCIYCNRPVGTNFVIDKTGYYAKCGDREAPCGLNVKILKGRFSMKEDLMELFREDVIDAKEKIIRHKLDTLFEYHSEDEAVRIFKKILERYNEISSVYEDCLKARNELYFDEQREEQIAKKTEQVNRILEEIQTMVRGFTESENPDVLKTAAELYIQDLVPEIENLRRLRYEMMEVENNQLIQWHSGLMKMEDNYLDEPKVVSFKGM